MSQQQGQDQEQQNALQNEFPASANADTSTEPEPARGDTQTSQRADSWRPAEDPAIEQAGGITQPSDVEPTRDQQRGGVHENRTDTEQSKRQSVGNGGS